MKYDPFATFINDVESMRRTIPSEAELVQHVASRLAHLNRDTHWLPVSARQPSDEGYIQHVLHVAPDGGFSVCALVWKPGQSTPVHDHVAWCVVGVYEGVEREIRYRLDRSGASPCLVQCGTCTATAGEAAAMLPDGKDIHSVINAGDSVAISIHVYGADLNKLGSSINRRFDHLPIRGTAPTAL
jgi:predicted metal-dependent enzyme (double-stranded beta helix superfamily)